MGATRTVSAQDYAGLIERSSAEASQFAAEAQACDLRILAEPSQFAELRSRVWPVLVSPSKTVRIWVPDCPNRAHAVSVALSALEYGASPGGVVVYATDSAEPETEARRCIFGEAFLRDLPLGFVRRWFEEREGRWQVALDVQRAIRVARHRLGKDQLLSGMDLVVLPHGLDIYQPQMRDTLREQLERALNPGGFLWISGAPRGAVLTGCSRQSPSSPFFRKDSGAAFRPLFGDLLRRRRSAAALPVSGDAASLIPLLSAIPLAVVILDRHLAVRFYTLEAQDLFSLRPEDIGRNLLDFRPKFRPDVLSDSLRKAAETGAPADFDAADTEGRSCRIEVWPYGLDGFLVLARSAPAPDGFPGLPASLPVPAAVLDGEGRVRHANQDFFSVFGCAPGEAVLALENALFSSRSAPGELRTFDIAVAGRCLHVRCCSSPPGWVVVAEDVTAQRDEKARFQAELEQSNRELRSLTASVFSAQEEERRRVARELHDDLAQRLAVLEMSAERLEQRARSLPRAAAEALSEVRAHAAGISTELRRIAHGLHPPALDDLGLQFALRSLASDFGSRNSVAVDFRVAGTLPAIPPDIAVALYRIAQEALRNVAKHAHSARASVTLTAAPDRIELSIEDEGRGFPPRAAGAEGAGIGLLTMEERARLIGGSLSLESEPGKGANVRVAVPLETDNPL